MEAVLTQTDARRKLTHDALLAPFYESFKPEDKWRVGAEAEKFGVLEDTLEPLPYDGPRSVRAVLDGLQQFGWVPESEYPGGAVIALKRGMASITLEPGAQLELSGAPFRSIHDTHEEWVQHIDELHEVGGPLGIAWLGLGFHPFAKQHDLPWVPKLRYGVMREYLPTRGSMGLDMMRRTSTVQSNLDYASEADAMRKLRVALALSPIVTAMFANSPLYEGSLSGERTRRALVWLDTDPDRTGLLPFLWSGQASFERYVEWALDVPMFLVKRDGKVVHNTGQTFRAFMRDGFAGTQATEDDWFTHLGTLFPEVRLKKTIELRGADCLPYALTPTLAAISKGLLYDDGALSKLEALLERVTYEAAVEARREIARAGLGAQLSGRSLLDWSREVVAIARDGLTQLHVREADPRGSEAVYLEPLEQLLARGESPADALLDKLDANLPLAPQVMKYARL
ncbi:MAG: Glutamate--cysteine ligase [Myxococcaceae bacterium]|nr:Glutamate--cysteine ligase [Myxococcaceae bacterium]